MVCHFINDFLFKDIKTTFIFENHTVKIAINTTCMIFNIKHVKYYNILIKHKTNFEIIIKQLILYSPIILKSHLKNMNNNLI